MGDYYLYTGMDNDKWYFWILDANLELVYRSESVYQFSVHANDAGCAMLEELRRKQ